jgi:hypothetical protein
MVFCLSNLELTGAFPQGRLMTWFILQQYPTQELAGARAGQFIITGFIVVYLLYLPPAQRVGRRIAAAYQFSCHPHIGPLAAAIVPQA